MRSIEVLVAGLFLFSGCTDPVSRILDREDAYLLVDHVDVAKQRSLLDHDFGIAEDTLRSRVRELERSPDPTNKALLVNARSRLADALASHRKQMETWIDFSRHLSIGDRVMYVHKRTQGVRYFLAIRGTEIVARSDADELNGAIE